MVAVAQSVVAMATRWSAADAAAALVAAVLRAGMVLSTAISLFGRIPHHSTNYSNTGRSLLRIVTSLPGKVVT